MIIERLKSLIKLFLPPIIPKLLKKIWLINKKNNEAVSTLPLFAHQCLKSYSQYQEDIIIESIFGNRKNGTFIDIGANDPIILNNTYKFYLKGWNGINIEPNYIKYKELLEKRKNDINLNIGIGEKDSEKQFYIMTHDTLSSFDKDESLKAGMPYGAKILEVKNVKICTLKSIFEKYYKSKSIDLLSIDVEGYEIAILNSNDWQIYRPELIVIEINRKGVQIENFLRSINYFLVYCNGTNAIFSRN